MGNELKLAFIKFITLVFISSFFFAPFQPVFAQNLNSPPTIYSVKLTDAKYSAQLSELGNNVRQLFVGAEDPEFSNIFTFTSSYPVAALESYLAGELVYIQPEQEMQTDGVVVNDPGFSENAQDIDKQWGLIKAGFDVAWEKTTGSKNNVVAIIDTGVDETHSDLKSINFVPGFNFISNQAINPGTDSDDNGHGTLIAGVLGATPNNGIGIAGANWGVSVMPVKALDSTGKGDADTVAEGIVWATDHGAQFLNLSVGGIGFGQDTNLANAISYAFNKNVVIVAAAGNDTAVTGVDLDQNPIFPVCDDNNYNMVIGVAATDQNDLKPDFSNYGRNCVDVDAPGKRILSTINFDPVTKQPAPNSYAYASGTSLAVPFVVAEAALIKTMYPTATNAQIRDRIITTADNIDNLNLSQCGGQSCRGLLGAGRINAANSLLQPISGTSANFNEGDVVKAQDTGAVYQILGGQKRLISSFVQNQRFSGVTQKLSTSADLADVPDGPYVTPTDGTLVKYASSPAIYIISNGEKLPINYVIFKQRGFSFNQVNTLTVSELDSWSTGNFLPPTEGTLVKAQNNPTVYWVVGTVLHPVNHGFYLNSGLNIFPLLTVPGADISSFAIGAAYIR